LYWDDLSDPKIGLNPIYYQNVSANFETSQNPENKLKIKTFKKSNIMNTENLTELNDQELLARLKKLKNNKIIDAVIIGVTFGIVFYSLVKNGLDFFTFFPLIISYVVIRNSKNNKILENEIQKELKLRNIK
jgi:hypothetical protein